MATSKEDTVKTAAVKADESSSDESDDDDLVLEGVLVRNPDVPSSSSSDEEEDSKPSAQPSKNKRNEAQQQSKKKQKKSDESEDMIQVEFTFCDMNERFFHGLKSLLNNSSTVSQSYSSDLANLMIENVSVGTVVSTEGDEEGNVFGFASVLNVTTYQQSPAIQHFKQQCLDQCPTERRQELEVVLSGTTKRPAGFFIHGRMINMPLEIVETLHHQLVLDLDWAVEHAEGGPDERKSLDFGVLVCLAPCQKEKRGGSMIYRYFDDEVFAGRADFVYTIDAPKSYFKEEKQYVNVLVLTKTGHREAMKDLAKLIHGSAG